MEAFFACFPEFIYDPEKSPETQFRSLQDQNEWPERKYKKLRRGFLLAVLQESESPLDDFFIRRYGTFLDYDCTGSPKTEFRRLQIHQGWENGSRVYDRARRLFREAFDEEYDSAVDSFFREYDEFDYNPRKNSMKEFNRLRKFMKWGKKSAALRTARGQFFEAFGEEFSSFFETGDESLDWELLCKALDVDPLVPRASSTQYRKKLADIHVNIYDLLQFMRTGSPFECFDTVKELAIYTENEDLYYPRNAAKITVMKFVLRVLHPRH